jgi:hypothetical protein
VKYSCRALGLHPNQLQTINVPARNLSGNFLITAVEYASIGTRLRCQVTAVSETDAGLIVPPDNRDFFRGMGGGSSTGSGVGSIVGGGGGGGGAALTAPAFLGGTDIAAIPMASTPAYTDVWNSVPFFCTTNFVGLVRVWLWADDAGVTVTARLRNVTDSTTAGTSSGVTATARPSSPQTFNASLVAGKEYRLQVISGTASAAAYGIGSVEAA